ncbi:hypothetical protein [Jannaschia marina]|uniref:hypothetical protein n=1 Tax=Jannaschia marina TaxID=2741674 RepID=UPI0015CC955C|nr:hypothetical protein [Jannaschia marina]
MLTTFCRLGAATAALTLLAACNTSSGGGAGGPGGGPGGGMGTSDPTHNAAFTAESRDGATASMPTSFSGTFNGSVQAQLRSTDGSNSPLGHATGDLQLTADWTDGQAGPAFTGTASNFEGEVEGTATAWDGTLNVDQTAGVNNILRSATCGTPGLPTCGTNGTTSSQRIGAVTVPLSGNLQVAGGTAGGNSNLLLAGSVSDDEDGMFGGTGGRFILPDGTIAAVAGEDSTWYVER